MTSMRAPVGVLGKVGQLLAQGEQPLTATGRSTTPFPRVDFSTNRKASNTISRAHSWLRSNAIAEAGARGDSFNGAAFKADTKPEQAGRDAMELYLFGLVARVPASILRPLTSPTIGEGCG